MSGISTPPLTAAEIGAKIATLNYGSIGTYCMAYAPSIVVGIGQTTAGGNLYYADAMGAYSAGVGSGTWRCIGNSQSGVSVTTWLRIA
jgi:hypothetical protein